MIQYAELLDDFTAACDYWIPAFAGMTAAFPAGATPRASFARLGSHKGRGEVGARFARNGHTRIGIST